MLSPELKKLKKQLEKCKDIEVDKSKLLDELKILDDKNVQNEVKSSGIVPPCEYTGDCNTHKKIIPPSKYTKDY